MYFKTCDGPGLPDNPLWDEVQIVNCDYKCPLRCHDTMAIETLFYKHDCENSIVWLDEPGFRYCGGHETRAEARGAFQTLASLSRGLEDATNQMREQGTRQ